MVGRAFARALRQEFAGKLDPYLPMGGGVGSCPGQIFPVAMGQSSRASCECKDSLWAEVLAVWVAWGTSHGGRGSVGL